MSENKTLSRYQILWTTMYHIHIIDQSIYVSVLLLL